MLEPLFTAESVPLFCNVQWPTIEKARRADTARLDLWACSRCGHGFNAAFDPARVAYSPAYDNSQHFSATFRAYAERLADQLIETYDIHERVVVDIGCGRGDLLALFADRGSNRGFGFDPGYSPDTHVPPSPAVTISADLFGPEICRSLQPALVCCRHVLEHVADPLGFLVVLREALANSPSAVLYLEVPNGGQLLEDRAIWDYIYEHVSYFTRDSLERVLTGAGFEVLALSEDFGRQFLCAEVRPATGTAQDKPRQRHDWHETLGTAIPAMARKLADWHHWAVEAQTQGRAAAIWGAGSKGVMFLNLLELRPPEPVAFVIDQNPNKHGRFVAATGHVIVGPEHLQNSPVEQVVLMNPIYRNEVGSRLSAMGIAPALIVA